MKRFFPIWIWLFLSGGLCAQMISHEVIASGGDFAMNGTYYVSSTMGEIVTETFFGFDHFLTQGFQQPSIHPEVEKEDHPGGTSVRIYPNPVSDHLKIEMILPVQNGGPEILWDFMLDIRNLTGNQILSKRLVHLHSITNIEDIDFSTFARGIYIIRVYSLDDENTINLNFKIVKM